jgi:hypothetical protein
MSCQTYLHNDPFDSGGTKFISGTTCTGSASSYNLTFGGSVCMEAELPLVICDGLTISGSCDSPVLSPTPTPTVSASSPPPCPTEITLTWLGEFASSFTDFNGTYYRTTSYTGGTFNYGWVDNDPEEFFHTGTSPDGNNYLVYVRTVGSTAYTLTNYYFQPTPISRQYTIFKTIGSLVNNQVSTIIGSGGIGYTGTTIGGAYILTSGLQFGSGNQPIYFAYPQICPTSTPTPTPTPTLTPT